MTLTIEVSRRGKEYVEIVVKVHRGGYPELFEELRKTSPRKRAERLKVLAFLGCMKLKEEGQQRMTNQQNGERSGGSSESEKDERMEKRKERLKKLNFVRGFEEG